MKFSFHFLIAFLISFSNPLSAIVDCCFTDVTQGILLHADWLSWKTRRANLDYAIVGETADGYPFGEIESVNTDRHSGLRVGLFYDCGRWDTGIRYTGFCPDQNGAIERIEEADLFPTRIPPSVIAAGLFPGSGLQFAESKYRVNLHVFELERGYEWGCYGLGYTFRPFGGIRVSSIDQNLDTFYDAVRETFGVELHVQERVDFIAYGLYAGLDAEFDLTIGVNFFVRSSLGLNHAQVDAATKIYDFEETEFFNIRSEYVRLISCAEMSAGGRWHYTDLFCADWTLQVAYEMQNWFCAPDFLGFKESASLSNEKTCLGFSGLVLRLQALF